MRSSAPASSVLKLAAVLCVCFSGSVAASAQPAVEQLRVFSGRSSVIGSPQPLARVSVSDPAIVTASVVSPTQVLVTGMSPGTASLMLWDNADHVRSFEVKVQADLGSLSEVLKTAMPRERIEANQSGSAIVLTGTVSSKDIAERAVGIAQTYSRNVVSMLVESSQQVLLQVRFAEVNKTAIQQLGLTGFSTGALDTFGAVGTGQFNQVTGNLGAIPPGFERGSIPEGNPVTGGTGYEPSVSPGSFGLSELLNIFFFRPDRQFGAVLRAMQQKNLLQILAEPNLLARNGREASFLAGGEFPFPVLQAGGGGSAVTIQFKEFGVRLKFTPNILPDDTVNLKVEQEVSALDFSNALTVSGFLIPAISSRRAMTEIQLRDGQTFAIAGLIDNRVTEAASKIPGFGDLPIIGKLFRSRNRQKNRTELLAMVTPRILKPIGPGEPAPAAPALPIFTEPFLKKDPASKGVVVPPAGSGR